MKRLTLILLSLLVLFSSCSRTMAFSSEQSNTSEPSIQIYNINGHVFEFHTDQLGDPIDKAYFVSNGVYQNLFIDDVPWYTGFSIGFIPDLTGNRFSPDRKFIYIDTLEYSPPELNDDGELSPYHEIYRCHIFSTENGENVYSDSGEGCDFDWDTTYSGLLLLYEGGGYNRKVSLLLDGESNPIIHYSNLSSVIKQVELLYHAKNYAKIREIAEKTIINLSTVSSKNVTALNNLGYYYSEAGAYVEALQILSTITNKFFDRAVAHLNLADTYHYMKNIEQAKRYYREYISIMIRAGKQDKIPQRVLAIFDGQSVEEILKD